MRDQPKNQRCPHCHTSNAADSIYCSSCGSPLAVENTRSYVAEPEEAYKVSDGLDFPPGQVFAGRYLIIEELGRGGMGRVFKARDKKLGITVALKMVRPEYSSNPAMLDLFKKETLLARSLNQENVIRIFDLGESQGLTFISMEYVSGQNLGQLMRASGALTEETTVSIASQVCKALVAAQAKDIVHRDLKPQNILVDANGRVHLADFGLAKSLEAMEATRAGGMVGTPAYLSPEQAKGEKVDTRADIYALGIIMYEMLTGRRPFQSDSTAGYIDKHIHEKPEPPSRWSSHIPPYLEKITLRCLEKNPAKRFQSAAEVLQALDKQQVSAVSPAVRFRRKKLAWAGGGLFVLALMLFFGYWFLIHPTRETLSPAERSRIGLAVIYFEDQTGDPSLSYLHKSLPGLIIQDLLSSLFIRVVAEDQLNQILEDLGLSEKATYSTSDLKRIGDRAQVNYIVCGSVSKVSDIFSVSANLYQLQDWKLKGSRKLEGHGLQSIYGLVNNLTPWLKETLDLSQKDIAGDVHLDVGKITTRSPEALKFYQQGMDFYFKRKFQDSNDSMARAVAEDPDFALAYWWLSINFDYLGKPADARKNLVKARSLALANRISPRERHLILGSYAASIDESPQEALSIYQKLLKEYPDDKQGLVSLGSLYRNLEEWDRAEECFLRVQRIDKYNRIAAVNLATIFMAKGQYDRARQMLAANREAFALAEGLFHYFLGFSFLAQGVYDKALAEIDLAIARDPDDNLFWMAKGVVFQLQADFSQARQAMAHVQKETDPGRRLNAEYWLAQLLLLQGRFRQCRSDTEAGIVEARESGNQYHEASFRNLALYQDLRAGTMDAAEKGAGQALRLAQELQDRELLKQALYYSGLVQARSNREQEALKTAGDLKGLVERGGNRKQMKYYHHLMGMIFFNRGSYSQAADCCLAALGCLPAQYSQDDEHAVYLDALARIYSAAGLTDKAQYYWEEITRLTTGRLQFGDIFALSYYHLGTIYKDKGLVSQARESFGKFLALWKDADRNLPQVEQARQSLAQLKPGL